MWSDSEQKHSDDESTEQVINPISSNSNEAKTTKGNDYSLRLDDEKENSEEELFLKNRWKSLAVVFAVAFVDLLGFGIVFPVLPFFALHLHANGAWLGIIGSSFSIASFFGSTILGRFSDSKGRKPILVVSLLGSVIGHTILGFSKNLYMIILARAIAGLFGGSTSVVSAYIADVSAPHERAKFMGIFGGCVGLGIVIGPAIGGFFMKFGFNVVAFIAAGICAANFLIALIFLKESNKKVPKGLTLQMVKDAIGQKNIILMCLTGFASQMGMIGLEVTISIAGAEHYALTTVDLGIIYSLWGLIMTTVNFVSSLLSKKLGLKAVLLIGLLGNSILIFCVPYGIHFGKVYLYLIVCGIAFFEGLRMPSISTLVSLYAAQHSLGFTFGAANSAARAISPITNGGLYDVAFFVPFAFGSLCLILASLIAFFLPKVQIPVPGSTSNKAQEKPIDAKEAASLTKNMDSED